MEFEFDKEIDAILRKAGGVEAVASGGAHMDADELAAFSENAVSNAARLSYVSHLADCARCRKILSNIVLSNSEAEAETASSAVSAAATPAERVPWYRRFFAFPQLAYTMGGAVLVFSAFFGYLIIKNLPGAGNSDVSFSTDKAPAAQRQNAANATAPVSTGNSNATTTTAATNSSALSNSSAPANAPSTANSAPLPTGNEPVVAPKPEQQAKPAENEVAVVPQATPQADAKREDKQPFSIDGASGAENAKTSPAMPTAGATATTEKRAKEDAETKDAPAGDTDDSVSDKKQVAKRKQPSPKSLALPGERRTVGGKVFDNIGGIWFDQAVGGKKPKTVRRGTGDYSKLDGGLRSIADQLGGTVVVLWGGKAYRIE
jgi:hypothetical protein